MIFSDLTMDDYNILKNYFDVLEMQPSFLNPQIILAWKDIFKVKKFIDNNNILYLIGEFNNVVFGWGPPLGESIDEDAFLKFLNFLRFKNQNYDSEICYLWREYKYFNYLLNNKYFYIENNGFDYLLSTADASSLIGRRNRRLRKEKENIKKLFPQLLFYNSSLRNDCKIVLKKWYNQKKENNIENYKLDLEAKACESALDNDINFEGIVVYINNSAEAFSIGSHLNTSTFNCIFEKASRQYPGLSTFVFSELADYLKNKYDYLNIGDDWNIEGLIISKHKWHPCNFQNFYSLKLRSKI